MEATAPVARRRMPSALIVALAAFTLTVLGAAPAHAADQCRPGAMLSPLPFSSFQAADGDQCDITGTAGSYDWQKIVADGGFGTGGGTALLDNDTATGLNVFKGGSKEQEPRDWGFTSDFPNNKTNILAAWGYPDAQPNHLFLYLAFAREDASGSVNYNFELNQNPPTETFTTSQGATVIKRREDDVLIAYDRTGNSSVEIRLCRWQPTDPANAHLDGTWSNCTDLTASGLAQAEINLNFPITNFLQGGTTLAAGQFGEAAIDLTAALNLGGPGQAPCADFGAFWVRSRQSGSITSDPSDYIPPSKVGVNNCGRVIVKKTTVSTATVPPTTFDFTADFNALAEGLPDTTPTAFELAGGDTETIVKVQPGTYALAETDPSAKGYDLTGLTCTETGAVTNTATTTSLATRTATLKVDSGEEITCTYTNTRRGQIIVEKQTLPNGDPESFGFTTSTGPFALTDGQTKAVDVLPGTHTVTEDAESGWSLSGLVCDDADSTGSTGTRTATFDISPGETVTCTFTNTKDGRLIVEKQTLPDGDAASFGFATDAPGAGTFALTDGATESRDVKPGTYTATEDVKAGWELTSLSCDDADSTTDKPARKATFDVSPGETVACTFVNTKDGQLIVEKQTLPDGDPATFAFATTAPGAGTFSLGDNGTEGRDVRPGTYTVTEDLKGGWQLTGLTCDDADSSTDKSTRKATFVIAPGEHVTCRFANTKEGKLVVEKQTLPNGDPTSFGFTTTAPGSGTFSLTDGGTQSRDVKPGTYTATENAAAGFTLDALTCSDQNSTTSTATRTATFDISPGETVTCTFTNAKDGRLIVEKQTLPDGDPATFAFTTTATGNGTFSLTDGATESRDVVPGTYTATENVKAGWELTGLSCSDQNSTTDKPNRKATFDISPGETVTCTFTNTKDGRLIVEKQTLPDGDATQFDFATSAAGSPSFKLSDGRTEARDVKPGTYTAREATVSGFRLDQVACDDADSTGDTPSRTATYRIAPGETVKCTFLNRTISANAIVVKAGNAWAYHGDTLTFTFTVNNSGQSPLTNVTVSDDRCAPVTLKEKRDSNGNPDATPDVLDLTDTWIYECTMAAPAHVAGETNPIVNTVTVGALDEFQRTVSDTDQHSTLLIHPAIAIDKTGPATAQAGQAVQYTLVVTNPGDVPFLAPNVNLADALCQAPPMLSTTNGDQTPGQLDPGDRWTYTCTVQTLVGQTVVNNVGSVTATDSYGGQDVADEDPATTQLTQPPVVTPPPPPPAPVPITSSGMPVAARPVALPVPIATARLSGPRRCVSGPFETKVIGRGIASVLFTLDGKKLGTVANTGTRTVFKVRIDPRGQSGKAHRVVAKVTFKAATKTRTRTLRFIYLGCARQAAAPQFTG